MMVCLALVDTLVVHPFRKEREKAVLTDSKGRVSLLEIGA